MCNIYITTKQPCYNCGSEGKTLYNTLHDRLFGVKGSWDLLECTNQACGLVWLDPMPRPDELPKLYENYYTHTPPKLAQASLVKQYFTEGCHAYLQEKYQTPHAVNRMGRLLKPLIKLNPAWKANLDFSLFYLPTRPSGKLLEVGCGSGQMLKNMRDLGWNVTGIDFDPQCQSLTEETGIPVYQGDLLEQNLPANSFDVIVMSHVIEHLPNPIASLQECLRLLRPEGRLIAITPNTKGYIHRYMKQASLHLDPPRHLHLFTANALQQIAHKAGFKQAHCFSTIRDFTGLWWASSQIAKHGNYQMGRSAPLMNKLFLSFLAVMFGYAHQFGWGEGDELVLDARK